MNRWLYAADGYSWWEIRLWPFRRYLRWHVEVNRHRAGGTPYRDWPEGWR